MEIFLGQIIIVGFNFAPKGYALCNGQFLSIAQNQALFALLGTNYGGNGITTFALPDFRGRAPIHAGNGAELTPKILGEIGGAENFTLNVNQLPAHSHTLNAVGATGNQSTPENNALAGEATVQTALYSSAEPTVAMNSASVGITGGQQPTSKVPPYLALNFAIALTGIFPSSN